MHIRSDIHEGEQCHEARRSPSPSATPQVPIGADARGASCSPVRALRCGADLLLGDTVQPASAAGLRTPAHGGRLPASTPASAASGTVTFGCNYSDDGAQGRRTRRWSTGSAIPTSTYKGNTVDHNSFQDNITAYLQQPDDVFTWFSGYRMRFFADKGLTRRHLRRVGRPPRLLRQLQGRHHRQRRQAVPRAALLLPVGRPLPKSLFEEKGYTIPTTKDELMALADKMKADGLIPFAFANDGKWPVQGTFDILNLRINGYQFHVDLLAGKEDWTTDKVKNVFSTWTELLPFHQENPNGRTWQEAATALERQETGMFFLGTFVASTSTDQRPRRPRLLQLPRVRTQLRHRRDRRADRRLHDGRQAEERRRRQGAAGVSARRRRSMRTSPSTRPRPANSKADTSNFNKIQTKSAELVGSAKFAQFLDRDTSPDFVSNVIGDAFANFMPTRLRSTRSCRHRSPEESTFTL